MRRNRAVFEENIRRARSKAGKAKAHFALAVLHDNRGRETEAIPHYREAIRLGLAPGVAARAHAYLASSLSKTGQPSDARRHAQIAHDLARPDFRAWVERLQKRIERDPRLQ